MRAFHNDPALKRTIVERMRAHVSAGDVVPLPGHWKDDKGGPGYCAVHDPDPVAFERILDIPRSVLPIVEAIFRGTYNMVPPDHSEVSRLKATEVSSVRAFPADWLEAIPVGVDLTVVPVQMMLWVLTDPEAGSIAGVTHDGVRSLLLQIAAAHRATLAGDPPSASQWATLRKSAMAMADSLPPTSLNAKVATTIESAAWPATASGSVTLDVFNAYIDELVAAAAARAEWTGADQELADRHTAEFTRLAEEVSKAFQGEARERELDRIAHEHYANRRRAYPEHVARESAMRQTANDLRWSRLLTCQRTLLSLLRQARARPAS